MPGADLRELASYLVHCSSISLGNFFLTRLDRASHLERRVREALRDWVQTQAMVELADLLRQHGEEIIATSARALPGPTRSLPERQERQAWPFTASNWFAIQDASDRANPRVFLGGFEKLVCWAIFRSANAEGWATLSLEDIGNRASLSAIRAKHIVRALKRRNVLECDNKPGLKSRYRIRPIDEWREPTREVKKPQAPTRAELRMQVGGPRPSLWTPQGRVELRGTPSLRLHHGDGSLAAKVEIQPGPVMIKVPVSSPMEITGVAGDPGSLAEILGKDPTRVADDPGAEATRVIDDPGSKSATQAALTPGSPATRVRPTDPPLTKPTRVASNPGVMSAPPKSIQVQTRRVPITNLRGEPLLVPGKGLLVVDVPVGKQLYRNTREDRQVLSRPIAAIVAFFEGKGWNTRYEPAPPTNEPKRPRLFLRTGDTGTWERAKREFTLNPHTFSTWIEPTREIGLAEADGALVISVPHAPFRKQLSSNYRQAVREAIGAATRKKPMSDPQFIVEGEYEIVLPGTQPAEQVKQLAAKGGSHK